ncbi:alpha-E domain-containing protein [Membranihabitans maritimus]|uniref:alpha-E domain-containing protein n=1 Tax=Membranihabitans maritimus TaxID=2904244 RepID=UPI001F1A0994|nr:alpha-E domain-containing protein [Membranihabitans maritimus]
MLARVADSLYWIGRYVERTEHCARYLNVQYYSTLEAPMSQNKDFNLRSIMFMAGSEFTFETDLVEKDVWQKVIFDGNNPDSIIGIAKSARENARSIRNNISAELWESINRYYLFCNSIRESKFNYGKIFSFTEDININMALIKSNIHNTLLHDDPWSFICLGIYVERSLQVLRIFKSKISDSIILSDNGANQSLLQYQWITLLKCLEAFDIHKNYYKGFLSLKSISELILSNAAFPRSLKYSTLKLLNTLSRISVKPEGYSAMYERIESKITERLNFDKFSEEESVLTFITEMYADISVFHSEINNLYFR